MFLGINQGFLAPTFTNKQRERSRLFRTASLVALVVVSITPRLSTASSTYSPKSTSTSTSTGLSFAVPAPFAVSRWRGPSGSWSALLGKEGPGRQPRLESCGNPRRRCLVLSSSGMAWGTKYRSGIGVGSKGGGGGCSGPLWATTTAPEVTGTSGDPAEDPSKEPLGPSGDSMKFALEDDQKPNAHAALSLNTAGPTNVTFIPSCDPHLVSDILEVAGGSIPTLTELQEAASAEVDEGMRSPAGCTVTLEGEETGFPGNMQTLTLDANAFTAVVTTPTEKVANLPTKKSSFGEKGSREMVSELVAFTLPLLVVWLSNPVMSLVDTAVVGAQSSLELAALGPGTSLCDNIAYMCGFLAQVTTNLCASSLASDDNLRADRATRTGLFVAAGTGMVVSSVLLTRGRALVQLVLGTNPAVSQVLPFSCSYVYIRALGFVAVTMSMVLQGAYLAKKDVVTPIKSVAGASVVNLVLDCLAVFVWGMGIKGAALSTTVAQWAALVFLLKQYWPDLRKSGKVSFMPYRKELHQFLSLGIPMCLALSGQVATCISLTVAASGCDTVALAAHQVLYGVFLLFCPIGEAVSQTVQTFLPAFTVKRPTKPGGRASRTLTYSKSAVRIMKVICAVALGLGVVDGGLAALVTGGLPSLFTPDRAVWAAMRSVAPLCGLALVLHGLTMAFQGAMMATREVLSTAAIYSIGSMVFSSTILLMRRSSQLTLPTVWKTFVFYQIARCATFASTVGWSHRASLMETLFPGRGAGIGVVAGSSAGDEQRQPQPEDDGKEKAKKEPDRATGNPTVPSSPPRGGVALSAIQGGDDSSSLPVLARLGMWPRILRARRGVPGLLRRRKQI